MVIKSTPFYYLEIEATFLGCPPTKISKQLPNITGVFLVEFGIGQMYLHYMTGCQLNATLLKCPHQSDGSGGMLPTKRILLPSIG